MCGRSVSLDEGEDQDSGADVSFDAGPAGHPRRQRVETVGRADEHAEEALDLLAFHQQLRSEAGVRMFEQIDTTSPRGTMPMMAQAAAGSVAARGDKLDPALATGLVELVIVE